MESKGTFVILINHASMPIRKERLSPTSKARRETIQNEFMEKGRMPDRVKSLGEIKSREDCSRARPGFVQPVLKNRNVNLQEFMIDLTTIIFRLKDTVNIVCNKPTGVFSKQKLMSLWCINFI